MTSEAVRLRLLFDDRYILSKSKKKEGLKRCWFLLKPHLNTISDLTSHLQNAFRLHRTCPHGITLSMDGFVLPSFESTCILKDKDIVCVKRKGSVSTDSKPAILPSENNGNSSVELQELLQIEGFQEEKAGYESVSIDDDDDGQSEGVVYVESKSDGNAKSKKTKASKKLKSPRQHSLSQEERRVHEIVSQDNDSDQPEEVAYVEPKSDGNAASKKRKASKKLKSPSQKKIKMSTAENLPVISEVDNEENESSKGRAHHCLSLVKKDIKESSNLSNQLNKSSNPDSIKQKNDKSGPTSDDTRFLQPQDEGETKKLPSRSARRKKAKRRWLRELKLEKEKKEKEEKEEVKEKGKEKLHPSPVVEKDDQQLPIKDNCVVSDVDQQSDEESGAEEDMVPVEIRPGHIRFQSRGKDQAVPQNQFSAETFQWNGITSKKKGQKWGKERTSSHKHDDYEQSNQDSPTIQNTEKKNTSDAVDFEKLTPYKGLPKEGDIIAYRLIELSASWTPELSSFRAGRVSRYDGKSNMIQLEPVSDFPFDFVKKIDEDTSPVQSDPSPYQEDGSLEIEYVSLADVRIIKHGHSDLATVVASSSAWVTPTKATNSSTNEKLAGVQTAWGSWKPEKEGHTPAKLAGVQTAWGSWKPEKEGHTPAKLAGVQTAWGSWKPEKEGHTPAKENGEVNVWDEINEALKAKKAKLSQNDGWRIEESPGSRSWSKRAMRCSALGPTMTRLRLQNGL